MPLLKNNVATSPLDRWPGTITFPEFLSLPGYQQWTKWLSQQVKVGAGDDSDAIMRNVSDTFGFVAFEYVNGNPGKPEVKTEVYTNKYLEPALMFGTLNLRNIPKGALKDPLTKMPYQLAIWINDVGKEWLERELSFPGYRDRIVVESEGAGA